MVEVRHENKLRGYDTFVLAHQVDQVYYMSYPCKSLSAWWVVYKVNPRERLYIPGDDGYQIDDHENCEIHLEDELPSSFNVDLGMMLDSLVGDRDDVSVLEKGTRLRKRKKVRWRPWGTRGQINPNFDNN
jgi:hypothetical protein